MKFEVVFRDYGDNETIVNEKFDSFNEADKWANDLMCDYNDIAIDDDGNDYWKTYYRFFNPEDKESYVSYNVQECF